MKLNLLFGKIDNTKLSTEIALMTDFAPVPHSDELNRAIVI